MTTKFWASLLLSNSKNPRISLFSDCMITWESVEVIGELLSAIELWVVDGKLDILDVLDFVCKVFDCWGSGAKINMVGLGLRLTIIFELVRVLDEVSVGELEVSVVVWDEDDVPEDDDVSECVEDDVGNDVGNEKVDVGDSFDDWVGSDDDVGDRESVLVLVDDRLADVVGLGELVPLGDRVELSVGVSV